MVKISFIFVFIISCFTAINAQVGINTDDPKQSLHIAGATGTMRVESLNSTNNLLNGGDFDLDGDLTNDRYPLYVDENGDFTLKLELIEASDGDDALDGSLPTSSVFLAGSDADGEVTTLIKTYEITVNRAAVLEVKYGISFNVYADVAKTKITDTLARRVENYITVTGTSRIYGRSAKTYSSGDVDTQVGAMYNGYSTYIILPAAGTYDVNIMGVVATNITADALSTTSIPTYVEFATGTDFLFIRLY